MSKFDSRIAEYLYSLSLDGMQDEEIGDVAELGWFARFDGPITRDWTGSDEESALSTEDVRIIATMSGAILSQDNEGFVGATTYASKDDLESAWSDIEDDYSIFDSEVLRDDE